MIFRRHYLIDLYGVSSSLSKVSGGWGAVGNKGEGKMVNVEQFQVEGIYAKVQN